MERFFCFLEKASIWGASALMVIGTMYLTGCLDITNSNTNNIKIILGPTPPLVPGCPADFALGAVATPTGVLLDVTPDPCGCILTVDGVSAGPASDGASLPLAVGTHSLQLSAGTCVSNVVTVIVE